MLLYTKCTWKSTLFGNVSIFHEYYILGSLFFCYIFTIKRCRNLSLHRHRKKRANIQGVSCMFAHIELKGCTKENVGKQNTSLLFPQCLHKYIGGGSSMGE